MPYLDIRLASTLFEETSCRQLALAGTRLANELLGKRPEVTAVSINRLPMWAWMTGRNMQSETGAPAAYAELTITAGSNSAEEKASFVAEMSAALKQALPGLSEASYVVVREVDAQSWGYDGVTQHARRTQAGAVVQRLPSGALNMAYYERQARTLRTEAFASWVRGGVMWLRKIRGMRRGNGLNAAGL